MLIQELKAQRFYMLQHLIVHRTYLLLDFLPYLLFLIVLRPFRKSSYQFLLLFDYLHRLHLFLLDWTGLNNFLCGFFLGLLFALFVHVKRFPFPLHDWLFLGLLIDILDLYYFLFDIYLRHYPFHIRYLSVNNLFDSVY